MRNYNIVPLESEQDLRNYLIKQEKPQKLLELYDAVSDGSSVFSKYEDGNGASMATPDGVFHLETYQNTGKTFFSFFPDVENMEHSLTVSSYDTDGFEYNLNGYIVPEEQAYKWLVNNLKFLSAGNLLKGLMEDGLNESNSRAKIIKSLLSDI